MRQPQWTIRFSTPFRPRQPITWSARAIAELADCGPSAYSRYCGFGLARTELNMRNQILCASALMAIFARPSDACTIVSPPVAKTVSEVASEGMLISGHVVQGFDADKEIPEIIRADRIFIGEGKPSDFIIYRSPSFYEQARSRQRKKYKRSDPPPIACYVPVTYASGQTFDRLVLTPANSNDKDSAGKWSVHPWGGHVSSGRGLEMLLEESVQSDRLQGRPPKSRAWGDCMECAAPDVR